VELNIGTKTRDRSAEFGGRIDHDVTAVPWDLREDGDWQPKAQADFLGRAQDRDGGAHDSLNGFAKVNCVTSSRMVQVSD
jgi:hypothetical protein